MAKVDTLQSLFVEELRDLLDAEKQLVRTLPKLARMATAPTLAAAFREHLEETRGHVSRLEQALEGLGLRASSKKCVGMQGLIEDGQETIEEAEDGPVRDAALIGAAQRAEHYEMAGYGTARTFATLLGHAAIASVLESTLNEEKAADAKLTAIAEAMVNPEAAAEPPAWRSQRLRGTHGGVARVHGGSGSRADRPDRRPPRRRWPEDGLIQHADRETRGAKDQRDGQRRETADRGEAKQRPGAPGGGGEAREPRSKEHPQPLGLGHLSRVAAARGRSCPGLASGRHAVALRIRVGSCPPPGGGSVPERSHVLDRALPLRGTRLDPVRVRCRSGSAARAGKVRRDVGECVQHRAGGRAPGGARGEGAAAGDPALDPGEHRRLGVHVGHDGRTQDAVGLDLRPRSREAHHLEGSEDLLRVDEDQQRQPGAPRRRLSSRAPGGTRRTSSTLAARGDVILILRNDCVVTINAAGLTRDEAQKVAAAAGT